MNTWQIGDPLFAVSAWQHLSRTTRTHLAITKTRTETRAQLENISGRNSCKESLDFMKLQLSLDLMYSTPSLARV